MGAKVKKKLSFSLVTVKKFFLTSLSGEYYKSFCSNKNNCLLAAAARVGFLRMKNDFYKIIFHPQTSLV
ncbi:MAG: hypothetical protein ACI9XO_003096 [Paraglaciecola sp.]|jgi:hypothetical protein